MKNPYAFLNQPDGIAPLMPQARRLIELREILAGVLPESLARCCSIANYKQGKVVIFAANGATAAKLKLMLPTLSEQLSKRGIEVTGLEVCVQPLASDSQLTRQAGQTTGTGQLARPPRARKSRIPKHPWRQASLAPNGC